jgi:hypothetical protein
MKGKEIATTNALSRKGIGKALLDALSVLHLNWVEETSLKWQ